MLFNSPVFLVFAVVFFLLWHALRVQRARLALLVVASFLFYGFWDWRFIFLLLGSGLVDFYAARMMHEESNPRRRRALLLLSIAVNLGFLGAFKYLTFAFGVGQSVFAFLGADVPRPDFVDRIVLPVGISFYTFQSMSYTIDIYRRRLAPTPSLLHFFAYLAMFPQLVAGPIERAAHMLPQLEERRSPTPDQVWAGWVLIVTGFFKKTLVADNLAPFVDESFAHISAHDSGLYWWLVAAMFATQIYCDFSGYSDIARGLAKLMGLNLMVNFDHPYQAASFREFWTRWHISLSTWFADYVYVPLGGSRGTALRGHVNMWITMLLSGLWHGAGWTFIAWGALHAAMLSVERITRWPDRFRAMGRCGLLLGQAIVRIGVLASWILFRADSISDALHILGQMFSYQTFTTPVHGWSLALVILALAIARLVQNTLATRFWSPLALTRLEFIVLPVMVLLTVFLRGSGNAFIYFQF